MAEEKRGNDVGRKAGELNQHGCSMTGYAFQIMDLAGPDLAVVIFGERDCASAFPRITSGFSSAARWNVYTAALRESDVVAGRAESRLRECLMAVADRMKSGERVRYVVTPAGSIVEEVVAEPLDSGGAGPYGIVSTPSGTAMSAIGGQRPVEPSANPAIVVLSTCLSEMTGADPVPVCEQVAAATGLKIFPVQTSGLRLRSQPEVVDHVASTLAAGLGEKCDPDPKSVNLIGYQTDRAVDAVVADRIFRAEAATLIERFGGRLNSTAPAGATVADWRNLPRAGLNFVVERELLGGLVRTLEGPGRRFVELPQAKGIAATDRFYTSIAAELGVDAAPFLRDFAPRAQAVIQFEQARSRFSGMRLAYGIGSVHNFRPDLLAMEGLSNLPLFLELGFEVEIIIQERDYPEVHRRIRRNLEALHVDVPYRLFYEPAVLEPALREGRFDCAYVADFMRDQVMRAGIPMLPFGDMSSGYWFSGQVFGQITRTLGGVFEKRFGRYFHGGSGQDGRSAGNTAGQRQEKTEGGK